LVQDAAGILIKNGLNAAGFLIQNDVEISIKNGLNVA
jgi:hypothetical protein